MFRALSIIPLHVLPLVAYALMANAGVDFDALSFTYGLPSGGLLVIHTGDYIFMAAIFLLFLEIVKAVHTGWTSATNNALSGLLFLVAFGLLLTIPVFGTTTFFFLTILMLADAIVGPIVTWAGARRDIGFGG